MDAPAAVSSTPTSPPLPPLKRKAPDSPQLSNSKLLSGVPLEAPSVPSAPQAAPYITKAARAKLDAGTKFFRFFVHCCCRHNDVASAFAGYCVARRLLLAGGSLPLTSAPSSAPSFPDLQDEQLRTSDGKLVRDEFLAGSNFKIESATFSSLLSLCDGVSPSDYLASGALNKAPSAAALKHGEMVPMQQQQQAATIEKDVEDLSTRWSDDVMAAYKCIRDALYAARVVGPSSSNSSSNSSSSTTTTTTPMLNPSIETRFAIATILKSDMDANKYTLTEVSYTAYIRVAAHSGHLSVSESLLSSALQDKNCKKKNRLFLDVLSAYCLHPDNRDLSKALDLSKTLTSFNLQVGETEYGLLLAAATHFGDKDVARRLLSDLCEDVLDPDDETRGRIIAWFRSAAAAQQSSSSSSTGGGGGGNTKFDDDTDIGSVISETGWDIFESFEVDSSGRSLLPYSSTASSLHHQLRSIEITTKSCVSLLSMNDEIISSGSVDGHTSNFQGGGKGGKRTLNDNQLKSRLASWTSFKSFLQSAYAPVPAVVPKTPPTRRPYSVVIDGANVGYFEKNFAGAPPHVDYQQVDWLVRDLARRGHSVLLVMHSRHFKPGAVPRGRDEEAVERWRRDGILAVTPAGMNDDWFWLHAALFKGQLQHVEGVDKRAGDLPFFVSNDEMRDHNFQMLAAREMMRWKERRRVSFEFGDWEDDSEEMPAAAGHSNNNNNSSKGGNRKRRRKVVLHFPPLFSRRIQKREGGGLYIPHYGEGNETRWAAILPKEATTNKS